MSGLQYRRITLRCSAAPAYDRATRAAVDLAALLGLELRVCFVEDEAVFSLAELPFGREIRLPTHEWRPIDAAEVAREYRHVAEALRRRLQHAAHAAGLTLTFEVVRGNPKLSVADDWHADDIVVAEAASERTGIPAVVGLLHVPSGTHERRGGPIVAIVSSAGDPALDVGARIAVAADEPLVVLCAGVPEAADAIRERARELGLRDDRMRTRDVRMPLSAAVGIQLADVRERLIVLGDRLADEIDALASARHVPVLLVTGGQSPAATR